MKTAIFLGAGASKAEGAPMQSELFKVYFESRYRGSDQMREALANFFRAIFGIAIRPPGEPVERITFPSFEEVLGLLDLAELRKESLRGYALEAGPENLRSLRQQLALSMAVGIDHGIVETKSKYEARHGRPHPEPHAELVKNLKAKNLLADTIFLSTNYDILIDNALVATDEAFAEGRESASGMPTVPGAYLDYGVDFTNFEQNENEQWWGAWKRPGPDAVKLYKLHGSLNWLYCPTCNSLTLTPGEKGAINLVRSSNEPSALCRACQSLMMPIIIPPTFYKDMSKVFLSLVWNKAEAALREVGHIIFCGYSFPDADIHIKYLIKRAQTNRPADSPLRFTVINNHQGKKKSQKDEEQARFKRFLGRNVKYPRRPGFITFAENPRDFYVE